MSSTNDGSQSNGDVRPAPNLNSEAVTAKIGSKKSKKQFLQNVGSGWIAVAMNALVGVFILPINLHYLGKEVYGVSVLAVSIMGLLHFLNFGLTPTLLRFFSNVIAEGDREKLHVLSSTSHFLMNSLGILGSAIFMGLFPWFCSAYQIDSELRLPTFILFCGLAISHWEQFFNITYGAILQSYQRLDLLNLTRSATVCLRVVLLLVFYQFIWKSLASLGIVIVLEVTFRLVVLVVSSRRLCGSACGFSPELVNLSLKKDGLLRGLFSFGALALINNVAMGWSIQIPALIIGKELSKSSVADFSASLTVANFLNHILATIVVPLAPLASIDAQHGGKRLGQWSIKIGQVVSCAGCASILVMFLFGRDWLTVWLGRDFAWTMPIVVVMAGGIILAAVQSANYNLALGASTIAPIAWSALVMAVLVSAGTYIGLHYRHFWWVLVEKMELTHLSSHFIGLFGVAMLVGGIRFIRNFGYIAYSYSKRFGYNYWEYLYLVYVKPLACVLLVAFVWKYTFAYIDFDAARDKITEIVVQERIALIIVTAIKSAIISLLFAALCWFAVIPNDLKKSFLDVFRRRSSHAKR